MSFGSSQVVQCTVEIPNSNKSIPIPIHSATDSSYMYYPIQNLNNNNNNNDDYTIAQWLEHRWLQARVPGSSPGGDSQFFLQTFPVCLFPSNQSIIIIIIIKCI